MKFSPAPQNFRSSTLYRIATLLLLVSYCRRDFYQGASKGIVSKLSFPKNVTPYGMTLIPGGRFIAGPYNGQGVDGMPAAKIEASVESFYMDTHPITNGQYLQYLHNLIERKGETIERQGKVIRITDAYIASQTPNPGVWKAYTAAASYEKDYLGAALYFSYPVVGVSWEQARAFCDWSTEQMAAYHLKHDLWPLPSFRLPTAIEYEYAARGKQNQARYPWGNKGLRNVRGKLMANFRLSESETLTRGYLFTSPVFIFPPNGYGLYDMAGNIQHWCIDTYQKTKKEQYDADEAQKEPLRVIKGCSWNHPAYFLDPGLCCWAHKNTTLATLGFRRVMPAPH